LIPKRPYVRSLLEVLDPRKAFLDILERDILVSFGKVAERLVLVGFVVLLNHFLEEASSLRKLVGVQSFSYLWPIGLRESACFCKSSSDTEVCISGIPGF
jgi:hypothetical protein